MKVLMLNTFDDVAGADRAARRLQQGVRRAGVDARLLVQFRFGDGKDVICTDVPGTKLLRRLKLYLGTLPVRFYPQRPVNNFTPALLPDRLPEKVAAIAPDIVHLHWLGAGFCQIETIGKFNRPLVWTLHDSWPFTGGCHVPGDCRKYREHCGACPVLGSVRENDLSRRVWERKSRAWRELRPTLVAPSRWLAACAGESSLFHECRIEVIPNGLDTDVFRPMDRRAARAVFGLPPERPLILFGAVNPLSDPNKGWHLLQLALKAVSDSRSDAMAVVFGADAPDSAPETGMPVTFLGRIRNEALLVAAYAAADVFVAPSLQEAFCQTLVEAMACGTPAVAFRATGPLDIVDHLENGYLAEPGDPADLARGIVWMLQDRDRQAVLADRARRRVVSDFALETVARRHLELYGELLEARRG